MEVVRDRILVVSEHPTYTRFFTFREHIEAFALLDLLGCHEDIIKLVSVSARAKNTIRMRRVNQFFRRADARDYLRRTVLCLRLTGAVHDISAAIVDKGKAPMLVRFARGEGRQAVNSGVAEILGSLQLDPAWTRCPQQRPCWARVWTCCSVCADTNYIPSRCP